MMISKEAVCLFAGIAFAYVLLTRRRIRTKVSDDERDLTRGDGALKSNVAEAFAPIWQMPYARALRTDGM